MAAWYLAHDDELLIDIDEPMKPTQRGGTFEDEFFRKRLRAAMEAGVLPVEKVWRVGSTSARHVHTYVRLARALPALDRLVWQLHLGSDLYRGRADLMRLARGHAQPSLLIERALIPGFYRYADHQCDCTRKHDTEEQYRLGPHACKVWRAVRGASPWELFGPTWRSTERGVRLPFGDVPLELIRGGDSSGQKATPAPQRKSGRKKAR